MVLTESDGASLFGAMINYFQMLGNICPKVLASTHFHGTKFDVFSISTILIIVKSCSRMASLTRPG